MKRDCPTIQELLAFDAVARHQSITLAAGALCIISSPTTSTYPRTDDAEVKVTALTVPLSSAFLRRVAPLPSDIER